MAEFVGKGVVEAFFTVDDFLGEFDGGVVEVGSISITIIVA